jgi:hypothetical protein
MVFNPDRSGNEKRQALYLSIDLPLFNGITTDYAYSLVTK